MSEDIVFDPAALSIDRAAVLNEAATLVDRSRGYLGDGQANGGESPEGEVLRALTADRAELAGFPDVYEIVDRDFITRQIPVPVRFRDLKRDFRFYAVEFPILLQPKRNWGFNRLELSIEFNAAESDPRARPKAHEIFPQRKFQRLFELNDYLKVGLDENFEFKAEAELPQVQLPIGQAGGRAGLGVGVSGGLNAIVGPFTYRVTRARLYHTDTGLETVMWRLDGREFFEENTPRLLVIARVPKATTRVDVAASMAAYRFFNLGSAGLLEAIRQLPSSLRTFFDRGAPIGQSRTYEDVTTRFRGDAESET